MSKETRVKILIIGESAVGKSSLLTQYVDQSFTTGHVATIGVEYKQKSIKIEDKSNIRVQIWDTAGTSRYNAITPNYYRNIDGILLVYDITDQKSFQMINYWIQQVNKHSNISTLQLMLVGNKIDLDERRQVSTESGALLAEQLGIVHIQTSAKKLQTTEVAFNQLVSKILKTKMKNNSDNPIQNQIQLKKPNNKKKQNDCC